MSPHWGEAGAKFVVAFNAVEGWSRDVSEEIAAELAQACEN
jgi:hypothetical protein